MATRSIKEPLEVGTFDYEWGEWYFTPKEIWNFKRQGRITATPEAVARRFLKVNHLLLGLQRNLASLKHEITSRGQAGYHVVFRQYVGRGENRSPLSGGIVSVHMNTRRVIYMCKCRAMPYHRAMSIIRQSSEDYILPERTARIAARKLLQNPDAVEMSAFTKAIRQNIKIRESKQIWWSRAYGQAMSAAWKIKLTVTDPMEEWNIVVSAPFKGLIEFLEVSNNGVSYKGKYRFGGKAKVFMPNPVVACDYHALIENRDAFLEPLSDTEIYRDRLKAAPESAYHPVRLKGLDNSGYLRGKRVTVNVPSRQKALRRANRDFSDIRARKPGSRLSNGFEEVMVYYHVDRIVAYLEKLGYRGITAIFKKPLVANVYWTEVNGSAYDGAWYNHLDQQLCFGTGDISDAEDGETIVHEVGHAVQDSIVNNFGQSEEAGAMGEGFSDYLAMSFFKKFKPEHYQKTVMSWDGLITGLEYDLDPPCQRHIHSSWYGTLRYENFVTGDDAWKHTNGLIWTATLWDIREALGRAIADLIIIEGHFELSPQTNMSRGARGIIHADRNLFKGKHEDTLESIFKNRGIPPYAKGKIQLRNHADYEFEQQVVQFAKDYPNKTAYEAATELYLSESRRPAGPIQMPLSAYRIRGIWKRYGIEPKVNTVRELLWQGNWYRINVLDMKQDKIFVSYPEYPESAHEWVSISSTRTIEEN